MTMIFLADAEATAQLARRFAVAWTALGRPSLMLHLVGELGAGKSSFARALLQALGVQGAIKSPTYTLLERYPLDDGQEAAHLDLYRLADAGELDFLGLDALADARLWLVEWPERGAGHLPAVDISLRLAVQAEGRQAAWVSHSRVGVGLLRAMEASGRSG